ncbi:NUDIX hydrolase [Oricola cellulosilytica]|uniref:NUDIX domain-containing protein n=2 Tax=Oricola cellulosilytica TaxID=1429082 RepID=A0A4R0PAJ7_9HYPH|nr:NUDIX domain-containing protein [Oricola cellulosilytica]TCD14270.1 NUDIX domain-containing protein [Oricola cellulosilytica]
MHLTETSPRPSIAVSVVARDPATGLFLLVRRGLPPAQGLWAFPGGKVGFGETLLEAAQREFHEETGLCLRNTRFHRFLELMADGSGDDPAHHFVLAVHRADASGEPVAGDDAAEASWFDVGAMSGLPITATTLALAREIADDT